MNHLQAEVQYPLPWEACLPSQADRIPPSVGTCIYLYFLSVVIIKYLRLDNIQRIKVSLVYSSGLESSSSEGSVLPCCVVEGITWQGRASFVGGSSCQHRDPNLQTSPSPNNSPKDPFPNTTSIKGILRLSFHYMNFWETHLITRFHSFVLATVLHDGYSWCQLAYI